MIPAGFKGRLSNRVCKLAALGHIVSSEYIVSHNAGTFTQTQLCTGLCNISMFKARHIVFEKSPGNPVLFPAFNVTPGQIPCVSSQRMVHLRGMLEMRLDMSALLGCQEESRPGIRMPVAIFKCNVPQFIESHNLAQFFNVITVAVHLLHVFLGIGILQWKDQLFKRKLPGMCPDILQQPLPVHTVHGKRQGMGLYLVPGHFIHLTSCLNSHIPLACAVNHHISLNLIAPVGIFHHNTVDCISVFGHPCHQGIQQQVHLFFLHHGENQVHPPVRVHIGKSIACLFPDGIAQMGKCMSAAVKPLIRLLHNPPDVSFPLGIEKPCIGKSRRAGQTHLSAQNSCSFHQKSFRPGPGCCNGRRSAGGAPAAYNHIINCTITHIYPSPASSILS